MTPSRKGSERGGLGLATRSPTTGLAVTVSRLAAIRQVLADRRPRGPTFARVAFTGGSRVCVAGARRRDVARSRLAAIRQVLAPSPVRPPAADQRVLVGTHRSEFQGGDRGRED